MIRTTLQRAMPFVFFVSSLVACTTRETKLKEAAIAGARTELTAQIEKEIKKSVTGKVNLTATAVRVLSERATFEVTKIDEKNDDAEVQVQAKTEPDAVQANLVEIMAKLEESKQDRFNVPDALSLIRQKLELPPEAYSTKEFKIKLHYTDTWNVVREVK